MVQLAPEEAFHRAFKFNEFDISEISMSSYIAMTARGEAHYVAIPAFVSRLFRHSGIYIRDDRGIARPEDLKGKTIGLPEYQMTANVWIRGMLQERTRRQAERHKMAARRTGRGRPRGAYAHQAAARRRPPKPSPPTARCRRCSASGELDGLISARAPSCFLQRRTQRRAAVPGLSGGRAGLFPTRPRSFRSCMRSASAARSSRSIRGWR